MTLWFYSTCISCEEDGDLYNDKCKECSKKRGKYDKKFLDSYCRVKNDVDPYDTQKYYCKICDKEFYVEDIFKEHSDTHKDYKILKIKRSNKLIIY